MADQYTEDTAFVGTVQVNAFFPRILSVASVSFPRRGTADAEIKASPAWGIQSHQRVPLPSPGLGQIYFACSPRCRDPRLSHFFLPGSFQSFPCRPVFKHPVTRAMKSESHFSLDERCFSRRRRRACGSDFEVRSGLLSVY